jgi:DNA-binding CsgD family transcriptional regulator
MPGEFTSGEALFSFDEHLRVLSWNAAAERLTGISREEAIGRPCWDLLGGTDERGNLICHRGCSSFRNSADGWPIDEQLLTIKGAGGRLRVSLSTIAAHGGEGCVYLHLLREAPAPSEETVAKPEPPVQLTARQLEVLRLIADGLPAKLVARRLEIAEPTVRNHIHAILLELDAHSQLEAVARARRRGLIA